MKKVLIVGVGALGSHVVQFLRNEAKLTVIDFDRIESKNLLSQFHSKINNGKHKVLGLQRTVEYLWSIKIDGLTSRLTHHSLNMLEGYDLIIDCVDNAEARRLIQMHARIKLTPCIHGALAADGQFGRVVWSDRFVIDSEANAGAPTCEDGEALPFIGIVATYIARAAQVFVRSGKQVGFEISPFGATVT